MSKTQVGDILGVQYRYLLHKQFSLSLSNWKKDAYLSIGQTLGHRTLAVVWVFLGYSTL